MQPQDPDVIEHEDFYRAYFGIGADYYLHKLALYQTGRKITFNLGAFFFGVFWMLYRKMYVPALAIIFLIVSTSLLLEWIVKAYGLTANDLLMANSFSGLFWGFVTGFGGNWAYLKQAELHVKKALRAQEEEETVALWLQQKGSITYMPHIIIAALILGSLLFYQFQG